MASTNKPLAFCSDHAGIDVKSDLIAYAQKRGFEVRDYGTYDRKSCDYPDFAHAMAEAIEKGDHDFGIAVCGSGEGISMALNKHQGIRAGLVWCEELGAMIRRHNNANVIVFPGRYITINEAEKTFDTFMKTEFEGGRHQIRIDKIPVKK
ncbi:MAG TPA: ribose-5-phosphate isomerase [Porphyromonadaceae bacterium]|nr:ribose-5-phosphate isomerase [Porphyromonadaceae bacterium]